MTLYETHDRFHGVRAAWSGDTNTTETVKSFEKRHLIFIVSFQSFDIDFTFEVSEVHC